MPKKVKKRLYSNNDAKRMRARRALETEEECRKRRERAKILRKDRRSKKTEEELELEREEVRVRARYHRKYLMTEQQRELERERARIRRREDYWKMTEEQRQKVREKKRIWRNENYRKITEEERQLLRERKRIQTYERYHNMKEEERRIKREAEIHRRKLKTKQEDSQMETESVGHGHPNSSSGCDELNVNHSKIMLEDVELKEKVFDNVETATKKRKLGREQSPEASAKICENVKLKKKNVGDVKASKEKRIFSCDKCPASFTVKTCLVVHMRDHTGEKPYICQTCGKQFKALVSLRQHMYVHTTGRQFPCVVCGKCYKRKSDFRNHVKRNHELLKCNDCNKMFVTEGHLAEHRSKHTGEKPYSCEHCPKKFVNENFFKRHMLKHEIIAQNFMKNCDKTSTSKTVEETQNVSTGNKLDSVSTCGKPFDQTNDSEGPVEIQLGREKPYICNQCDNQYPDVQSFYRHINRHISSEKLYTCENCHRAFKYKSRYEDHICKEAHACTQCNKSFKFFRQLERHKIKIHNHSSASESLSQDVIVIESSSCDEASSDSKPDDCRLESVVKRFVCNQCGELFHLKIKLISHLKIHNDENLRRFRQHKSCIKSKRHEDSMLHSKSKIHTETETRPKDSMLLLKSKMIHTGTEMPYCATCDIHFSTYSETRHHNHKIHKKLHTICNLCNRIFNQSLFTLHYMKYHVNKNYLRCTSCNKQFMEIPAFFQHMNKIHGCTDKHYCTVCNKLFATESDLQQHHMVHRDSKPYVCEICCETFLLESDRIAHKMSYAEKMLRHGSEIGRVQCAEVHTGSNILGTNVLHGYNISTTKQQPGKDLFRGERFVDSSVTSHVYMEPNGVCANVQQSRNQSMSKQNFPGRRTSGTNQQSSLFFENDSSTIFGSSSAFQRANSIQVDPAIKSSSVAGRVEPRTDQIHENFPKSSNFSSIDEQVSNEENFDTRLSVEIEIGDVFTKDNDGRQLSSKMDDCHAPRELRLCCAVCFERFPTDVDLNWHLKLHSEEIIVVKPESDQYNNPSGLGPTNEHTVVTHDASACSKEKVERSNVSESGGTLVCRNGTLSMPGLQDSSVENESFNYCISESELLLKKEHEPFQSNDGELQSKKHEPFVPVHTHDRELQSKTGYEVIRPLNSCNGDIRPEKNQFNTNNKTVVIKITVKK